jgi:xanthine dehydrogenase YagS FAD-binding subunit
MNPFAYTRAETLPQALAQLKEPGVMVKAGGVDLIDQLKEGLIAPTRLVDLSPLGELRFVRADKGILRIGALTTLAELEAHPEVRERFPALAEAAGHAATPQIRNAATLGGNLAQRPRCWYFRSIDFHCRKKGGTTCFAHDGENQFHALVDNQLCAAVHASTPATALIAYDAKVALASPNGTRELPLDAFFVRPDRDPTRENQLQPDELVTEVRLPAPAAGTRAAYTKQGERESYDWPIADVAVVLEMDGRSCKRAAIGLGAFSTVPLRARAAEGLLQGKAIDARLAGAAAKAAVAGATPLGKNGYKLAVFVAVIRRTILAAAGGAS